MIRIVTVNRENAGEIGFYCVQNRKSPGFHAKTGWFNGKQNEGVVIKIALNEKGKQLGFIEYMESEKAWRPVKANGYLFIQCILLLSKEARSQGIGSMLVKECVECARQSGKSGVCVVCSEGPWIAGKTLFMKNGFSVIESLGRFDLLALSFEDSVPSPRFIDWRLKLPKYEGWNLVYADQCPWHEKSVKDLLQAATDHNIELKVHKLSTPAEAQEAPSGFGTFALIRNGKLIEDHYLSRTRFENILRKESADS